jgi:hypothetical protein
VDVNVGAVEKDYFLIPFVVVLQQDSNTNQVAKVRNSCMTNLMIDYKLNLFWFDFV